MEFETRTRWPTREPARSTRRKKDQTRRATAEERSEHSEAAKRLRESSSVDAPLLLLPLPDPNHHHDSPLSPLCPRSTCPKTPNPNPTE